MTLYLHRKLSAPLSAVLPSLRLLRRTANVRNSTAHAQTARRLTCVVEPSAVWDTLILDGVCISEDGLGLHPAAARAEVKAGADHPTRRRDEDGVEAARTPSP